MKNSPSFKFPGSCGMSFRGAWWVNRPGAEAVPPRANANGLLLGGGETQNRTRLSAPSDLLDLLISFGDGIFDDAIWGWYKIWGYKIWGYKIWMVYHKI